MITKLKAQDAIRVYHVPGNSSVGRSLQLIRKMNRHIALDSWWGLNPKNRQRAKDIKARAEDHIKFIMCRKVEAGNMWEVRPIGRWYEIRVKTKDSG